MYVAQRLVLRLHVAGLGAGVDDCELQGGVRGPVPSQSGWGGEMVGGRWVFGGFLVGFEGVEGVLAGEPGLEICCPRCGAD